MPNTTIGARDVLNAFGFGIDPGERTTTPIDDIVALGTMITTGEPPLRAMLVAFDHLAAAFQNTVDGDCVRPMDKTARGPLGCAIDDSRSMGDDHRRDVAHAIALALDAKAVHEGREVHLIKVSRLHDEMVICRYPDPDHPDKSRPNAVTRFLTWATMTLGGGSRIDHPLMKIAEIAEASPMNGCDAVVITDEVAIVSNDVIAQWRTTRKERDLGLPACVIDGEESAIAPMTQIADQISAFSDRSHSSAAIASAIAAFLRSRRDGGMRHTGDAQRSDRRQFKRTRR